MAQLCYLTNEIQNEQALVHTENWKNMSHELKDLKETLLSKLIRLAIKSVSMHNAQLDPLVIKGLCLALDRTYRVEDFERIREHCEVLDKALDSLSVNNVQLNSFSVPGANDEGNRALQIQILETLLPTAQKAYLAWLLGKHSYHVNFFFYQALTSISSDPRTAQLKSLIEKSQTISLLCTELLESAYYNKPYQYFFKR